MSFINNQTEKDAINLTTNSTTVLEQLTENITCSNYSNEEELSNNDLSLFIYQEIVNVFMFVNYVSLGQAINIFGLLSNIVSFVIFLKLGFKDKSNISFLALTVSDFFSLLTLFFFNLCQVKTLGDFGLPFEKNGVCLFTFAWSHIGFSRITCYLTAFIAVERCLCIVLPFTVKSLLTVRRTAFIVTMIFPLAYMTAVPVYLTASLSWAYYAPQNRSLLIVAFKNDLHLESITYILNGVVPLVAFISIVMCTCITVYRLKINFRWRQQSANNHSNISLVNKNHNVGAMVVLISTIFILCYLPSELIFLVQVFDRGMIYDLAKSSINAILISFVCLLETVNASVNVFVYLSMSTKYRDMFVRIFLCRKLGAGSLVAEEGNISVQKSTN